LVSASRMRSEYDVENDIDKGPRYRLLTLFPGMLPSDYRARFGIWFKFSLLIVTPLFAAARVSAQANIVVNGTFAVSADSDSFPGWTTTVGFVGHIGDPLGPNYICLGYAGTLYQDLHTVSGASYLLRFATRADDSNPDTVSMMKVHWGSALLGTLTFTSNGSSQWSYPSYYVRGDPSTTRLLFEALASGTAAPCVGDVSVVAVPEPNPAIVAVLCGIVVGLTRLIAKRRRGLSPR